MKSRLHSFVLMAVVAMALPAKADVTLNIDETANWLGYMSVTELPVNGGAFVFGSSWGPADLQASFNGPVLTLAPNIINDPDPFWYIGGGGPGSPGNKIMDANMYVEPEGGVLAGQNVTFTGTVVGNTLTSAHTAVAFIKDFAPDYSSVNLVTAPLVNGTFSITLATDPDPARHVQYGFQMVGENVWATDVAPFGSVQVQSTAPSPNVTVDQGAAWQGRLAASNLPAPDGDGALFMESDWPVADLTAVFDQGVLSLGVNMIVPEGGDSNPDYFKEDFTGNKIMTATLFVEFPEGQFSGETINFSGTILSNTFVEGYQVTAFIRDYAPDFSSFESVSVPLVDGTFNLSLATIADPARHVRYGFETVGVNVSIFDFEDYGSMELTAAAPPDPFTPWIAGFDFSAYTDPDLTKTGDPDGDGVSNLEEFALDGNPASAAASGKVRAEVDEVFGDQALVLTLPVRDGATFNGTPAMTATVDQVTYTIDGSDDLGVFDQVVQEVSPAIAGGMPAVSSGWTYRTFRLAGAVGGGSSRGPRGFLRANVSAAP